MENIHFGLFIHEEPKYSG